MSATGEDPPQDGEAGFTLIELLVVLVLIGLLLVAVPNISFRPLDAMKLRASAEMLASDLRLARNTAITRHREERIDFDLPHNRYRASTQEEPRQLPRDARITLTTTVSGRGAAAREVASIEFLPDGTSAGARIELREGASRYVINLNWLTGRVWSNG